MMNLIGNLLLVAGLVTTLAVADAKIFEEAELSPLYQETLNKAYSRFKESEAFVYPGRRTGSKELDLLVDVEVWDPAQKLKTNQVHDHNGPHFVKGAQFLAEGKLEESLAEYRLALLSDPNCAVAKHQIAGILSRQGDWQEAIVQYRQALKVNPERYCIYEHLGDIYHTQRQIKEAQKYYNQFIQLCERNLEHHLQPEKVAEAQFNLANFYLKHDKELEKALKLSQALSQKFDHPNYLTLQADIYEKMGQSEKAQGIWKQIKKEHPDFVKSLNSHHSHHHHKDSHSTSGQ